MTRVLTCLAVWIKILQARMDTVSSEQNYISATDCFIWVNAGNITHLCVCIMYRFARPKQSCRMPWQHISNGALALLEQSEYRLGWMRWGWLRELPSVLLVFKRHGMFSVHKDTEYSCVSFHTSQSVKIQIGKTVLPYFTDFWVNFLKILILIETNGRGVGYGASVAISVFLWKGKENSLPVQLDFRNRLFNTAGGERLLDFYLNWQLS